MNNNHALVNFGGCTDVVVVANESNFFVVIAAVRTYPSKTDTHTHSL